MRLRNVSLGAIVVVAATACAEPNSGPPESMGSGAGGHGEAGGGDGGCPDEIPDHGSDCDTALTCPYDDPSCNLTIEAVCINGRWDALQPAGCNAATTCDPSGTYVFTVGAWSPEPPPTSVEVPSGITVMVDADGIVWTSAANATSTDGGCSLNASWTTETHCPPSEPELCDYETYRALIDFSLPIPAGELRYSCEGECTGDLHTAPLALELL